MKKGRPAKFNTAEELDAAIAEYFDNPPTRKRYADNQVIEVPYMTICGLALHLGFESRQSFYDYEKREDFSYAIKRARLRIEDYYESNLQTTSPTGSIFALKNLGWKDKQDHELTGKDGASIEISFVSPKD